MVSYCLVVVVILLIPFGVYASNKNNISNVTAKDIFDEKVTSTPVNTTLVSVNITYSETNGTDVTTYVEFTTTNTTISNLGVSSTDQTSVLSSNVSSVTNTTASIPGVTTDDSNKTFDGEYNVSTLGEEQNVVYHPTEFPPVIQDIDEGLVAGMSVLVVVLFGGCILFGAARICYKNRQRKTGSTFYEEVEDAATSCSIEGSSNVKFLIARARNINKSRIEQINEEWRTGKLLINSAPSDMNTQPPQDVEMKDVSKSPRGSQRRKIVEEEDSEYATAEPEEDIYSLAGSDGKGRSSVTSSSDNVKIVSDINPRISQLEQQKLQRSQAFDDGDEDPYEDGPDDEYDILGMNKKHKILSVSSNVSSDEEIDEHLYELTDDTEYALPENTRPRLREPLHRSKSQERLSQKAKPTQPVSKNSSEDNVYDVSFEGEYDLLNKPRFRITISSDNYDNVQLPWECDNVQSETKTNQVSDSGHFDALENSPKAESNLYSDMDALIVDKNANANHIAENDVKMLTESEPIVQELNGNNSERANDLLASNDHIDNKKVPLVNRNDYISEERPYSLASQISSGFSSESSIPNLVEIKTIENNNSDQTFCDNDNSPVVVQNRCFDCKLENGNISGTKLNELDLDDTIDDEIINLVESC